MAASPQHATLVANTVATITFDEDFPRLEVVNVDGAAEIYFRCDGVAPVIGAAGTHVLPAAIGSVEMSPYSSGATVVKLISAGTPKISARGIR